MSLPAFDPDALVPSTFTIDLEKLFPPDHPLRIFSNKVYPILCKARQKLAAVAYCLDNGAMAVEPVWLMGIALLQFLHRVPDRQAKELFDCHPGWKLALHCLGDEEPFHFSVVHYFRQRVLKHEQGPLIFKEIKQGLVEAGLIPAQSGRRLDSLQMWGLVEQMNRLDCMRESLRLALEELAQSAEPFAKPAFWSSLWDRYVEERPDYRSPAKMLRQKMDQAGADAVRLLGWVKKLSDDTVVQGAKVQLLKRVLSEQFEDIDRATPRQREAQPTGAVHNPHEPEAQWAAKGRGRHRKEHVGYKIQVVETVVSPQPVGKGEPTRNFLDDIITQPASASDEAGMDLAQENQAKEGQKPPPQWYVDAAYVSAQKIAEVQAQGGELIGPAQPAPRKEGRYSTEDFTVEIQQRQAVCPAGKTSTQCSRLKAGKTGKVSYRFEWSTHCQECALRQKCLGPEDEQQKHRSLFVGEHHDLLQARRLEQKTETFKERCHPRNGIEGTISELNRGHGMKRARYRGQAKVSLQNYLSGAACNVKRWIRLVQWELEQPVAGAAPVLLSG